ncbi:hypothetical protein F443_10443 [Phytophthora nicotianae P1569]|uniref:DUF659 domain-containing protein n=2 Tax=Phytophthora nicotianae TaxID=4792 RepID=V9F037_PHYNI|nr:hypothetical protein F443_10443 [Phytophthora nicotianae P1569]
MFGFVDEITLNIYQWMRWIIQRNSPITEVENKLTREVVTMTRTTVRTMKTYMRFTAAKVDQTIEGEMGESFALMYDGWTCHSLHLLGIFAVYVVNECETSGSCHSPRRMMAKQLVLTLSTWNRF